MNRTLLVPALLVSAFCVGVAQAETPTAKPKAAATKPAKPAAKAAAPVEKPLPAADQEQLAAAQRALTGEYACEFDQKIDVGMSPKSPGYLVIKFKNNLFTMKPVLSSTGALRLEDVTGRTLWIQIANKSMLMDTKIGQRMVDNCVHPEQAKFKVAS
jgi:hypothetical protein